MTTRVENHYNYNLTYSKKVIKFAPANIKELIQFKKKNNFFFIKTGNFSYVEKSISNKYKKPTLISARTKFSLIGITAHATKAKVIVTIGARIKTTLFALAFVFSTTDDGGCCVGSTTFFCLVLLKFL